MDSAQRKGSRPSMLAWVHVGCTGLSASVCGKEGRMELGKEGDGGSGGQTKGTQKERERKEKERGMIFGLGGWGEGGGLTGCEREVRQCKQRD